MLGSNRTPYWELHIRPLFRRIDRDHMLRFPASRRIDLFSYDEVVARSKKTNDDGESVFLSWIHHPMPPAGTGGPWPDEWIDLFKRWMEADYPRLGRGTANELTAVNEDGVIILNVKGTLATESTAVFMDRTTDSLAIRDYEIFYEPTAIQVVMDFEVEEAFPADGVEEIWVTDFGNGRQRVPIS